MPDQPPNVARQDAPNAPTELTGPSNPAQPLPGFGPIYNFLVNQFLLKMTPAELDDETRVNHVLSSCQRTANKILANFKSLGVVYQIPQSQNPFPK